MSAQVTYKTHILVGVRPNGIVTVIGLAARPETGRGPGGNPASARRVRHVRAVHADFYHGCERQCRALRA